MHLFEKAGMAQAIMAGELLPAIACFCYCMSKHTWELTQCDFTEILASVAGTLVYRNSRQDSLLLLIFPDSGGCKENPRANSLFSAHLAVSP